MRPQNWPALLGQYVDDARGKAFAWGVNDCVTFSGGWVGLVTGQNPAARFVEKYADEAEARAIMASHGVDDYESAGRFLFGEPDVLTVRADRGDIVLAADALGICLGLTGAFVTLSGLVFLRRDKFRKFWRVD